MPHVLLRRSFVAAASASLAAATRLGAAALSTQTGSDHYDYLVIGAGSGGVASARRAAMYGKRVVLVERGPEWAEGGERVGAGYGGTCVNVGCVPKKLMFTAASFLESAEESVGYGIEHVAPPRLNWPALVKARDKYVERLNGIYARNLDSSGVERVVGGGGGGSVRRAHIVRADCMSTRKQSSSEAATIWLAGPGVANARDGSVSACVFGTTASGVSGMTASGMGAATK